MGMAASQARFLGLTARKTNTEYEGQQVNQQRTALANQSAGLFNQMMSLEVPTPPLATNFSRTEYVFTDPSTSQKIYLDSIYKNPTVGTGRESYTVSGTSKSASVISNISTIVPTGDSNNRFNIQVDAKDKTKYTISVNGGTNMSITDPRRYDALIKYFGEAEKASGNEDPSTYPQEGDTFFKYTNPNTQIEYYIYAGRYEEKPEVPSFERDEKGKYKLDAGGNKIPILDDEGNQKTEKAVKQNADGTYILDGNNKIQIDYAKVPMTVEELAAAAENGESFKTYSAESYTKNETFHYDDAQIVKANDGTGRYESITFYTDDQIDPVTGKPIEGSTPVTCKLTQQTVQDEAAFDAAMETYNAKKVIYDKSIADIDAKTSVIQQQDKTLELHLNQLDTEQQAIQTEMDAVKKVIDKNIEETFKTFA